MTEVEGGPPARAAPEERGVDGVAWRLFALLVRRSRGPTGLVEDLLGRPVRSTLVGQRELARIEPPGLVRLDTTGPVLRRHVVLTDSLPPHLPVAVVWSVVVPWRLPDGIAGRLRTGSEPLDRLLVHSGLCWTTDAVETDILPVEDASTSFPWASAGSRLVEQARVVHLDATPVATTIDEVPFLPPRDPDTPLLPVTS